MRDRISRGQLSGGSYQLPGNISSQYISGLLFALPLLQEDSFIHLSTPLESAAYIDMTLAALKQFGVQIHKQPQGYAIPGRQRFHSPGEIQVEGDWSNAAFFLVAGAIGQSCTVSGLDLQSPQGDREIVQLLRRFGAQVQVEKDRVSVSPAPLHGCTIDISQVPDLLPILAVTAACATGESRFIHAARLRLKESDRLTATAALLHALGIHSSESPDSLIVQGGALLGGTVDSYHDHRIAMATAIAATRCRAPVTILDAAAVEKSYPGFFTDYIQLGGQAYGI